MKKKFLLSAAIAVMVVATTFGMMGIMKMTRASNAAQVVTVDKGTDSIIVETMRSCVITVSSQGLTNAGVDQAHRLCWNRAELVGKTHKGH